LPLLVAMARGEPAERQLIRHAIEHGEVTRMTDVVAAVRRTGAIDAARDLARAEAEAARDSLSALPPSRFKEALLHLCVRAVDRSS
jgi:octaprenyl-diphosphate synthase